MHLGLNNIQLTGEIDVLKCAISVDSFHDGGIHRRESLLRRIETLGICSFAVHTETIPRELGNVATLK